MVEKILRKSKVHEGVIFFLVLTLGLGLVYRLFNNGFINRSTIAFISATFLFAFLLSSAVKIAYQWEIAIVFRLGKFYALRGPGPFFVIPLVDTVPYWIDTRMITTTLKAEKILTKDRVPVNADALLCWKVVDPMMATLNVVDYTNAIEATSKATLRAVIGKTMLFEMMEGNEKISKELQRMIEGKAEAWGLKIISVEIKDVLIAPVTARHIVDGRRVQQKEVHH